MSRKITTEYVREFFANRGIKLLSEYQKARIPVKCECMECGHIWTPTYDNVLHGKGCPNCAPQKAKKHFIEKYGVDNPMKTKEVRDKFEKTMEERYGVKNSLQSPELNEKRRQTCQEKFGADHALQNPDVLKRTHETLKLKYGVENPMQVPEFRLKAAKTCNQITEIPHWKTGQTISCQGSYETKTVIWLNQNKINYIWQPGPFPYEGNKTYTPDLYLPDQNIYVEIKGHWYDEEAKVKWEWFHKEYPNSEIWLEENLVEKSIL